MPLKSIFRDVVFPEGITLSQYMLSGPASQDPMAPALIDSATGQVRTFDQVKQESMEIGASLHALGIGKGDMVAVCLPNCMEYMSILAAITSRGAVHCGINPGFTQDEFEYHLNQLSARLIFVSLESINNVDKASKKLGLNLQLILVGDKPHKDYPNAKPYADFFTLAKSIHPPPVVINPKTDPAILLYSSGTTGRSKGVLHSHASLINGRELLYNHVLYEMPKKGDHLIGMLPMYHIMGLMSSAKAIADGIPLIVMRKYEGEKMLILIEKYKVPLIYCVPPIIVFLAKDPVVSKYDLTSLRGLFAGAAPIGKELTDEVLNRLPHIKILTQAYGLTETVPCFASPKWHAKSGSVGMLMSNNMCKIINVETGKECGPYEPGEICLKTPTTFLGYYGNEKATAEMFDEDGWLHTGDVGYYDSDQCFFIVDRVKDLIKVKGFQVSPAELEDLLLSHPEIDDAAVIGVPDPAAGELPKAFVVKKPTAGITAEDIHKFIHGRISSYKLLKGGIEFIDSIPKLASGKILRRMLKQNVQEKKKTSKL